MSTRSSWRSLEPSGRAGSLSSAAVPRSAHRLDRLVVVLLAALLAAVVAVPPAVMYLRLHPARHAVIDEPGRHGLASTDLEFASPADGTTIRGWYLRAQVSTRRTVVIAPGIDDTRLAGGVTLRLAPALLRAGYDVLAIDLRAEGKSDGDLLTFGATEQWDVLGAVATARRLGALRVAVLGFSLGGDSALLAAARDTSIDAVVAESAFADLPGVFTHELTVNDHLPAPVAAYATWLFGVVSGVDAASISPVRAIATIDRPVLLIQGDADRTIPVADSDRLLAAGGSSVSRWTVPGGAHALSYDADPAGYTSRLLDFLARSLG